MFLTGSPAALRQPFRTQPVLQRVMPLRTYSLSVWTTTRAGAGQGLEGGGGGGEFHAVVGGDRVGCR